MKVPSTSLDPILSGESIRVLPPLPTSLQQLLGQIPLPQGPPSTTPLPRWGQGWGTQPPVKCLAIPWTCRRHLLSLKGPVRLQHQPCLQAAGAWACCGQSYCRHWPCPGPSTLRKCWKGFCLQWRGLERRWQVWNPVSSKHLQITHRRILSDSGFGSFTFPAAKTQ